MDVTAETFARPLSMAGSEGRARVLVQACQESPDDVARELLRDWFNMCDALAPWATELREQFERVGFVTDTDEELVLPATVYRAAWEDDDSEQALSWTLSRATAEMFARQHTGPRGWFLGTQRSDVDMLIWQATCTRALGYLQSRGEREVIAAELEDIQAVAKLVTVPATEEV